MAANPTVFKQMVLPPVFGPVITNTLVLWAIKKSTGTGGDCSNLVTWHQKGTYFRWNIIKIINCTIINDHWSMVNIEQYLHFQRWKIYICFFFNIKFLPLQFFPPLFLKPEKLVIDFIQGNDEYWHSRNTNPSV